MKKDILKPVLSDSKYRREAGILLHITSLPSKYGIGDLGPSAYEFVDALNAAGQKLWEILPLNPTGYGNSPYQSTSGFAGNTYFISPEILIEKGLLKKSEADAFGFDAGNGIDYGLLYTERPKMLRKAYSRWVSGKREKEQDILSEFINENKYWLNNYAIFAAIKDRGGGRPWIQWETSYKDFKLDASDLKALEDDIQFHIYCQYEFFSEWKALRHYANSKSVRIIGDMPFYVSSDSADVWADRKEFMLSEDGITPLFAAGVPADGFADKSRSWGNIIYDWDNMEISGFIWWRERVKTFCRMYDCIRLDHIIALVRFYAICTESGKGCWYKGPDAEEEKVSAVIFEETKKWNAEIIAEDLGSVNDRVHELINKMEWSCSRVLQFAVNNRYGAKNNHITYNHPRLSVIYTGTHDNRTTSGFVRAQSDEQLHFIMTYLKTKDREALPWMLIEEAYRSPGLKAVIPMQDILGLGDETRMVFQESCDMSWQWRMKSGDFGHELRDKLKDLAEICGR